MSAAHTPGPLTVDDRGIICHRNPHGYQQPVKLAGAWVDDAWIDDAEAMANARLYAAAPDLLEAATLAEDIIDDFRGHLSPDDQIACEEDPKASAALKALRAAITKAAGQ